MNPVLLGGSLLISALPAAILLAKRLRKRQVEEDCAHRWIAQSGDGPWTCRWCFAVEHDCPHETWLLPPGATAWSCRSCGALTGGLSAVVSR
ncbi:MAG: hypothetical protein AB7N70_09735 [Dehalococcoidia bacterium]